MEDHDNTKPMTLTEMEAHAKKFFNETFETREAMFVDAFRNGEYHEADAPWYSIAQRLTNADLTELTASAIHIVISGVGGYDDGEKLREMMDFFESLRKFMDGHLKSPDEILNPLAKMRAIIIEVAVKNGGAWWIDSLRGFSLVDFAIQRKMGMWAHEAGDLYDDAVRKCSRENP